VLAKQLKAKLKKDALGRRAEFLSKELEVAEPPKDATVGDLIDYIVFHETGVDLPALAEK